MARREGVIESMQARAPDRTSASASGGEGMAVAGKKPRRVSDKPARSVARHALRFLLGILIAVACVPLVLVPVYRFVDPPVSTLMLRDMVRGQAYSRTWVDIDEMAPVLAHSVIVSEDARFCVHNGVDWGAIRVVVNDLRAGKTPRGASTTRPR